MGSAFLLVTYSRLRALITANLSDLRGLLALSSTPPSALAAPTWGDLWDPKPLGVTRSGDVLSVPHYSNLTIIAGYAQTGTTSCATQAQGRVAGATWSGAGVIARGSLHSVAIWGSAFQVLSAAFDSSNGYYYAGYDPMPAQSVENPPRPYYAVRIVRGSGEIVILQRGLDDGSGGLTWETVRTVNMADISTGNVFAGFYLGVCSQSNDMTALFAGAENA